MVVSVGHFDSDQEKFVVDGKLHNGTALPGSTDAWRQSVTHLQDNIDTVGREFHRLENMPHLNCRVIDRPATHPRDEYSLMMKMKTPYRMASILPPASEYKALQTIATNADTIDLPSKEVCESNPSSIRRYSGPSDGQPL